MGCPFSKKIVEVQESWEVYRKYEFLCLLGKGSTSQVHEAQNKTTGEACAIKCVVTTEAEKAGRLHLGQVAQELWGMLEHPNVCKLLSMYQDQQLQYFVMELLNGSTLFGRLEEQIVLMEADAGRMGFQMFSALDYIHGKDICHRDPKPESWLLSDNTPQAKVKLIDFGLAEVCREGGLTEPCGTLHYLAPEVLRGSYGKAADVWTLGVVLFLALYADYPFDGESAPAVMQSILSIEPDWSDSCFALSPDARNLLHKLLVKDEAGRPTSAAVVQHGWFRARQRYSVLNPGDRQSILQGRRGPRHSLLVTGQMVGALNGAAGPMGEAFSSIGNIGDGARGPSKGMVPIGEGPRVPSKGMKDNKFGDLGPFLPCVPLAE